MKKTHEEEALDFMIAASNDESWIDASHPYARTKLAKLLEETYQRGLTDGRAETQENADWLEAHRVLGVWPGAYDD